MAAQSSPFSLTPAAPAWRPASHPKTGVSTFSSRAGYRTGGYRTCSYRTWFKRIALAGWLFYAVGIILLPFWDEIKERNLAFDRVSASYDACKSVAVKRGISEAQSECDSVYRARMERDDETYKLGSEYRSMGWHVAWVVPVAVFVPPLIFFVFVYGTVLAVTKTVNCLSRGLRE